MNTPPRHGTTSGGPWPDSESGAVAVAVATSCALCPLHRRQPNPPLPFRFANPYAFGALVWNYMADHKDAAWQTQIKTGNSMPFLLAAREMILTGIARGEITDIVADDIERILEWHFDKGNVARSKEVYERDFAAGAAGSATS